MNTKNVVILAAIGASVLVGACKGSENKPAEEPSRAIVTTTSGAPSASDSTSTGVTSRAMPGTTTPEPGSMPPAVRPPDTNPPSTIPGTNAANTTGATPAESGAPVAENPGSADHSNQADNTRVNARDKSGGAVTPTKQGAAADDRKITVTIRQALVGDKKLSLIAKSIKVTTKDGKVTLRGPIKSEDERQEIERRVKDVSGVVDVDDQLEVKNQTK
jgi:hypothetical protein